MHLAQRCDLQGKERSNQRVPGDIQHLPLLLVFLGTHRLFPSTSVWMMHKQVARKSHLPNVFMAPETNVFATTSHSKLQGITSFKTRSHTQPGQYVCQRFLVSLHSVHCIIPCTWTTWASHKFPWVCHSVVSRIWEALALMSSSLSKF